MIRGAFGLAVFAAAALTAAQMESLMTFLGAALGAFAARYASRNFDKQTITKAVQDGIANHVMECPLRKDSHGPYPYR